MPGQRYGQTIGHHSIHTVFNDAFRLSADILESYFFKKEFIKNKIEQKK